MKLIAIVKRSAVAVVAVAAPVSAFAAGAAIDVSPVTDAIGTGLVAVAAIGAAVLGFVAIRKVWRLINASV